MIANGNYGATSSSTGPQAQSGKYADSQPTYQGYYAGKLTDGKVSPSGTWAFAGAMGWNTESGPFTVTINLGKAQAIGSVHADHPRRPGRRAQLAQQRRRRGRRHLRAAEPGHHRAKLPAAGTSGAATLTSHLVTGGSSAYDTAGTITMPMYSVTGQYVTISGTCTGWCLFDEMQILSPTGTVISTGDTYTVTPQPTNGPGGGTTYGDDGYKLTDGDIIPAYGPQFAAALDSFTASTGGTVQATWATPHTPSQRRRVDDRAGQQHRRDPAPVRHHLLA